MHHCAHVTDVQRGLGRLSDSHEVMQKEGGSIGVLGVGVSHKLVWPEALALCAYTGVYPQHCNDHDSFLQTVTYSRDVKMKDSFPLFFGMFLLLWLIWGPRVPYLLQNSGLSTPARGTWLRKGVGCCKNGCICWGMCTHHGPSCSQRISWVQPAVGRSQRAGGAKSNPELSAGY